MPKPPKTAAREALQTTDPTTEHAIVPLPRLGRPTKDDYARAGRLYDEIRRGNYYVTACRLVGIDEATFESWCARGDHETTGPYRAFLDAIRRAEGEAESVSVDALRTSGDWRGHASWLGRRHRDRWSEQSARVDVGGRGVTINIGCFALPGTGGAPTVALAQITTVPRLEDED